MITLLGDAGVRPARACDDRTGQMAKFDAAGDLAQPIQPCKRWSQALNPL